MAPPTLHLRAESKPLEHRSCLTPTTTKALIDEGYTVHVERSSTKPEYKRIFADNEFEAVGAKLVPEGSWTEAPKEDIIIGLKELPEHDFPLIHTHISFSHCYKGQSGWERVLSRFPRGNGLLLDLEFLQDETGRRVAAFGYHAGFAGAALAVKALTWQATHDASEPLPGVDAYTQGRGYYENEDEMIEQLKQDVKEAEKALGRMPRALVIGALGRCGKGAVDLFTKAGIPEENVLKWDMAETAKGGPFEEIVESDIFVNCIYLSEPIPPFVDMQSLNSPKRKLAVVCDVSCDTTNPHNPIPIYSINTLFSDPTVRVPLESSPTLTVISIDHLPSLMPRESSEAFSAALLPSLKQLKDRENARVWKDAEKLFNEKVATLPKA
jgi:saccharopine dehydrogenase (NAD+, L-lysine-forming)